MSLMDTALLGDTSPLGDTTNGDGDDGDDLLAMFAEDDTGDGLADSPVPAVNGDDGVDSASEPGEEHEFEIIDQLSEQEEDLDDEPTAANKQADGEDYLTGDSDDFDDSELHELLEKDITKDRINDQQGVAEIKNRLILTGMKLNTSPNLLQASF